MTMRERAVVAVLLSGGIDSAACVDFYLRQGLSVQPLFVDYGQPASRAELRSARAVSLHYGLGLREMVLAGASVPRFGEIPGRNLFLVSVALMTFGTSANLVALGVHEGSPYFDCGKAFVQLCERLLEGYTDGRVRLGVPFLDLGKWQVWAICRQNRVPVHLTWSCEASSSVPCGECLSCKDKEALLAGA